MCSSETAILTAQEEEEYNILKDHMIFDHVSGHLTTKYPFKQDPEVLVDNSKEALACQQSQERRQLRNGTHAQYVLQFQDMLNRGVVEEIMRLKDVEDSWKILLLMGIGVFTNHKNSDYTEIMKKLAVEQKLYLIVASTDYIYGTNYQFSHGYIGKDLAGLTQEKTIQAMGRIGRNNVQQDYTLRFRDDGLIKKLFTEEKDKPEVRLMNRLFSSE